MLALLRSNKAKASSRSIVSRGTSNRRSTQSRARGFVHQSGRLAPGLDQDRRQSRRGRGSSARPAWPDGAQGSAARPSRSKVPATADNRGPGSRTASSERSGRSRSAARHIRGVAMVLDRFIGRRGSAPARARATRVAASISGKRSRSASVAARLPWRWAKIPSMRARSPASKCPRRAPNAAGGDRLAASAARRHCRRAAQPIFGARGEHPIGLGDALQDEVVDHHADIAGRAVEADSALLARAQAAALRPATRPCAAASS
jgi:hypothetical protein